MIWLQCISYKWWMLQPELYVSENILSEMFCQAVTQWPEPVPLPQPEARQPGALGYPQTPASSSYLRGAMARVGESWCWKGQGCGCPQSWERFSTESKAHPKQKRCMPPSWNFLLWKRSHLFSCLWEMVVSWALYPRKGARWLDQNCPALRSIWWIQWQVRVESCIAFPTHFKPRWGRKGVVCTARWGSSTCFHMVYQTFRYKFKIKKN